MEKLKLSSDSLGKVNKLIDKINQTCDMLMSALEINSESVGIYGISLTQKMNTDLVDRILNNIANIKNHLIDLKREVNKEFAGSKEDIAKIITSLLELGGNLDVLLNSNLFFQNNFEVPVREINSLIDRVFEKVQIN